MADSELMLLCSCGLLNHSVSESNIQASAVHCARAALGTSARNALIELHIPKNLEEVGLFPGSERG